MLRATDLRKIASHLIAPPPIPQKGLNDSLKNKISDIKVTYPDFCLCLVCIISCLTSY